MRVVIATRHLSVVGGAETHLRSVLPLLQGQGYELALLHEYAPQPGKATLADDLRHVPIMQATTDVAATLRQVQSFAPDLIYSHGLDAVALESALVREFPAVLFLHNYDGLCISGTRSHQRPAVAPCERPFGAGCLLAYFPCRCGGKNPLTMWSMFQLQRSRLQNLHRYAAVLTASQHIARTCRLSGVAEASTVVVPLFPTGIERLPSAPQPRPISGRLLFVGRLVPQKGLDRLIAAVPEVTRQLGLPLQITVAGDGPDRGSLERLAQEQQVSLTFTGWLSPQSRNEFMAASDLLVVPSLWPEPFGLVGIEAGCVGVPSVAYSVGGIPEWLSPGVNGELVAAGDLSASALATAICRALGDPVHWQRLRAGAWEQSLTWTAAAHVTRLTGILAEVSRRRSLPAPTAIMANVARPQTPQIVS